MSVTITKDKISLRELLAKVNAFINVLSTPYMVYKTYSGTGSQTVFIMPAGWKPYAIYIGGTRVLDVAYSLSYDINICSITFTSAPASGTNNIQIDLVRI